MDMVLDMVDMIDYVDCEKYFMEMFDCIGLSKLVIIDCFYVMIFLIIIKIFCFVFGNSYGKVKYLYWDWFESLNFIEYID